jgi:hypothetical protein
LNANMAVVNILNLIIKTNLMKKIAYSSLFLAATALVLWACNFSAGTKKDFGTGLSQSYKGFSVEDVLLVGPDNTAMTSNEVKLNTQVAIVVQGLTNYELKDNKAFPGLMIVVTDKQGNAIINDADLFDGTEGYPPTDAAILRGTVTVGDPMKAGETYHVKMRVWDKNKLENELTAEVDIVVK